MFRHRMHFQYSVQLMGKMFRQFLYLILSLERYL